MENNVLLNYFTCGGTRSGVPPLKRKDPPTRRGDIAWRAEARQLMSDSRI